MPESKARLRQLAVRLKAQLIPNWQLPQYFVLDRDFNSQAVFSEERQRIFRVDPTYNHQTDLQPSNNLVILIPRTDYMVCQFLLCFSRLTSRAGGLPNMRAYSRLN